MIFSGSSRVTTDELRLWVKHNTDDPPTPNPVPGLLGLIGFSELTFSLEQVRHHNKMDDGWVVNYQTRRVYNITPLLPQGINPHHGFEVATMRDKFQQALGGGADIAEDVGFHGVTTQKRIDALFIGYMSESDIKILKQTASEQHDAG